MTFILAGKLRNEAFLMVDMVLDSNPQKVNDKLYNSLTNKKYIISLSGHPYLLNFIQMYEDWMSRKSETLVLNREVLVVIFETLSYYVKESNKTRDLEHKNDLGINRVFIIYDNNIKYYTVNFKENELEPFDEEQINENQYVNCFDDPKPLPKDMLVTDIFSFSKDCIYEKAKRFNDFQNKPIIPESYFIDGFSLYSSFGGFKYASMKDDFKYYINITQLNTT
jgi:hypothetical protein